jgi:hypothetical protein
LLVIVLLCMLVATSAQAQVNSAPTDCSIRVRTTDPKNSGPKFDEAVVFLMQFEGVIDRDEAENLHYPQTNDLPEMRGSVAIHDYFSKLSTPLKVEYQDGHIEQAGPYLMIAEEIINLANRQIIIHAFTGTCGTDIPPGRASLVLNATGLFWNSSYTITERGFRGGSLASRAVLILHELCHGLDCPGFETDLGNPLASARNDDRVLRLFPKTITALNQLIDR